MIAKLKNIYSLDVECPLDEFIPELWDYFELTLTAMIGPTNEDSAESFQIQVCTPKWLQARCNHGEIVQGRHSLIVGEFNFAKIREYIDELCRSCSGSDWQEIAQKLSRYGQWEFEDYQPYKA